MGYVAAIRGAKSMRGRDFGNEVVLGGGRSVV